MSKTDIPALAGFRLEDSYVLDLVTLDTAVVFVVDLAITPEHPEYQQPGAGEQLSFRRARLEVSGARTVHWVERVMRGFTDATGEVDFGCIDSWRLKGELSVITGDWGVLEIDGGTVVVELLEPL